MEQSVIHAFQNVLLSWIPEASGFGEQFAVKRFQKKFERPDNEASGARAKACWETFLTEDKDLPFLGLLPREWYLARLEVHRILSHFRMGDVSFSNGSLFSPSLGRNSVEARLSEAAWECTPRCFELWAATAYRHKALKRAAKRRFIHFALTNGIDLNEFSKDSWEKFSHEENPAFLCFRRMLSFVTRVIPGSRFGTVPKNNLVDRPICVEGFCNMIVQRRIGIGIRNALRKATGIDLTTLQQVHRWRIKEEFAEIATLDLKNASDSIQGALVKRLVPPWFWELITASRSHQVVGPDGCVHTLRKVSSMGNGFTFELMSMLLTALCRQLDRSATVYGDDIIIKWSEAYRCIRLLSAVGFRVNVDKSFIHGDFRESCGANYHWKWGYIPSFDFVWPSTIGDCVVTYNKVVDLSGKLRCFEPLRLKLLRCIPHALRGSEIAPADSTDSEIPLYFRASGGREVFSSIAYQLGVVRAFPGFRFVSKKRSRTEIELKNRYHWAKYEMYLLSGRVIDDVCRDSGQWERTTFYACDGRVFTRPPL